MPNQNRSQPTIDDPKLTENDHKEADEMLEALQTEADQWRRRLADPVMKGLLKAGQMQVDPLVTGLLKAFPPRSQK